MILAPKPTFFSTETDLRACLEISHETAPELLVGFWKKGSGKPSIDWPQARDQALCFGWIDGIRKSVDGISYTIRFTPRKPRSVWSAVNIKRVEELDRQGRMQPAGLKAYEVRIENKSGIYSYEQRDVELEEPYGKKFKQNREAWKFFQAQPASYRKAANWWVLSAKKEETRLKRLEKLIEDSAHGRRIPQFTRKK